MPLGAHAHDDAVSFCVWAPAHERLHVRVLAPVPYDTPMTRDDDGYHTATLRDVVDGARYGFLLDDRRLLPDPASRFQPDGVHEPSQVVASAFDWQTDIWTAPTLDDLVLYELHVGTFTGEGTFDAIIPRLRELKQLGVNALELLPIAQFPGARNWGYDGVFAFAAQSSYGGPHALKRLVDAAHAEGMWIFLDVVYNHLGPEGNYLPAYAPYFTDVYRTPWGAALNYDEADSDHVRRYFIESALQWIDEFRIDGLRLDAVHAIHDRSALPFLREITAAVHERAAARGRSVIVIAESDLGDPRVMRDESHGGWGMDAQWLDDFHHSLRALVTGENAGYYADFGTIEHLAQAYRTGYVYRGQHSTYRRRRHGAPGADIRPRQFVAYAQNHDQVGNRMAGDRLSNTATDAQLRLAAAAYILSPFTPMLFMGEEYGETRPFPYFVSHGDAELVDAVRKGRREEFAAFAWQGEPPDPQAETTFRSGILDWGARERAPHRELLALYRRLLELRRADRSIRFADTIDVSVRDDVILVRRSAASARSLLLLNFGGEVADVPLPGERWTVALDTAAANSGDTGASLQVAAHSAVLLTDADA